MTTTASAKAERTYTIDAAHSSVAFVVRHMMIAKVRGHFKAVVGTIGLPASGNVPSSIEATIEAASIDTREPQRDGHLSSPEFFDAAQYPRIAFKSTRIEGTDAAFKITGDLTLHGATREVTLDATFEGSGKDPWGNQRLGYEAHGKISRANFGLTYNQALESGGVLIGDEVTIELSVEAVPQG